MVTVWVGFSFSLSLLCVDFYSAVRKKWVNQANKLRNVTVLSVGGGYRDYQVRSGLTSLPCPSGDPNKLSLVVSIVCGLVKGHLTLSLSLLPLQECFQDNLERF